MGEEYPNWYLSFKRTIIIVALVLVVIGWTYDRVNNALVLRAQYVTLAQAQQALNNQAQQYEAKIKGLRGVVK